MIRITENRRTAITCRIGIDGMDPYSRVDLGNVDIAYGIRNRKESDRAVTIFGIYIFDRYIFDGAGDVIEVIIAPENIIGVERK